MREWLDYGYIPHAWRAAKGIFIPKPGKTDHENAEAFRPVCITFTPRKAI